MNDQSAQPPEPAAPEQPVQSAPPAQEDAIPKGAFEALLGLAAVAFLGLLACVIAFGLWGETLTAGVDAACAEAAFNAGEKMQALGNYDEAIRRYEQALEGRFQDPERAYMCGRAIGDLHYRLGRDAEAIAAYEQLPPEALDTPGGLTGYVSALWRTGRIKQAAALGEQWLANAQEAGDVQQQVWAHHTLARVLNELGKTNPAIVHLRAIGSVDPGDPANVAAAAMLVELGKPGPARAQLEAFVERAGPGPAREEAARLLNTI